MRKADYKDLDKYRAAKRNQRKRFYAKTAYSANYKKRYTLEEYKIILDHELPDMELSRILGRSVNSIQKVRYRITKGDIKLTVKGSL